MSNTSAERLSSHRNDLRFLSGADVDAVGLQPEECISIVRGALRDFAQGCVEMPPKSGVHPPKGRHVHAMSAWLGSSNTLGLKWIADFPRNREIGYATLSALIVLNDPDTGMPVCIMEGGRVTAARTAAMTAVSLLACARAEPSEAAIIGTGVQARAHAKMLPVAFPDLRQVRVAGHGPAQAAAFCREIGSPMFQPAGSAAEAVTGSDIVITLTNAVRDPLLEPGWLKEGATIVVLDNGGKETRILPFVDRIVVDDRRAFENEEVHRRFVTGVPKLDAEIGEILIGRTAGREDSRERILILNLGIAACDIAVAAQVYQRASQLDIGTRVSL